MSICEAHQFDPAEGTCRSCSRDYCAACLVYPFGQHKPPFCLPCALQAAGIRRSSRPQRGRVLTKA